MNAARGDGPILRSPRVLLIALIALVILNLEGCPIPDTPLLKSVKEQVWPTVAGPVFKPTAGTYSSDQTVTITCEGATIYYTIDGSTPGTSSQVYNVPIHVSGDGKVITIKAFATQEKMNDSLVASATYTIDYQRVSTPQFNPVAGTYATDQNVEIRCDTGGATIYYTTDNTVPTRSSAIYSSLIPVAGDGTVMTIKAFATKAGMTDSTEALADYKISYPPEMNVKQGSIDVARNGTANYGSVGINTQNDLTFSIENLGTGDLILTGSPDRVAISGPDAALFSTIVQPGSTIAPGFSSTFSIRLTMSSLGYKTAVITIPNNDSSENPYTFTIAGTGILPWASPPKTGQVTSYVAGDDGDLKKGVAWPSPRFTDNLDGTMTDNLTGLMWEKSPTSSTRTWNAALGTEPRTVNQ